jgi:predicted HicB family RNase H-like nuclease
MLRQNAEVVMNLRPAIQLRFRSTEQHEQIKASAAKSELSVNEYILCAIEYAEEMTKKREHAS